MRFEAIRRESDDLFVTGHTWLDTLTAIERAVEADLSDAVRRGHNCWSVITGDHAGYVQWVCDNESALTIESASQRTTLVIRDLEARYPDLRRLGWKDPDPPDRPNWYRDLDPTMHGRPQMTAELCTRTLREFYAMDPSSLELTSWGGIGRRPLLQAIR